MLLSSNVCTQCIFSIEINTCDVHIPFPLIKWALCLKPDDRDVPKEKKVICILSNSFLHLTNDQLDQLCPIWTYNDILSYISKKNIVIMSFFKSYFFTKMKKMNFNIKECLFLFLINKSYVTYFVSRFCFEEIEKRMLKTLLLFSIVGYCLSLVNNFNKSMNHVSRK